MFANFMSNIDLTHCHVHYIFSKLTCMHINFTQYINTRLSRVISGRLKAYVTNDHVQGRFVDYAFIPSRIASEFKWQGYSRRTSHYPLHTFPNVDYLRVIPVNHYVEFDRQNRIYRLICMLARTIDHKLCICMCVYVHLKSH